MSAAPTDLTTWPRPTVFEPARLGSLMPRNRIVKAATFEGRTPKGQVTEGLCIPCNKRMPTICTGTRCVVREASQATQPATHS